MATDEAARIDKLGVRTYCYKRLFYRIIIGDALTC